MLIKHVEPRTVQPVMAANGDGSSYETRQRTY